MTAALAATDTRSDADTEPRPGPLADSRQAHRPRLRVVVRPAPQREPPFDDEVDRSVPVLGRHDRRLPFATPAEAGAAPARVTPSGLPDPAPWGRRLLVGLIEAAEGRRSLQQLGPVLSFAIVRGLSAELERAAQSGQRHWLGHATVRSVRATEPATGVAELSASVERGGRVRAVALRLEHDGGAPGRWRCTRLQLG